MSSLGLILVTIVGIAVLLYLIMHSKMQAFLALLIASIFIGIFTGMDPTSLIETMEEGMGGTLGFIAIVVGLGAMFGEMLRTSGGAERLAFTLVDRFGENRAQWALALTGFIVAIPVFLDVALVILLPIVYSLAMRTGKSLLYYAIPLLAGLAVAHSFIPPTPGPIAVASVLGVDLGWMMLFGIIAGLPAMIIAGPLFGRWIGKRVHVGVPAHIVEATKQEEESKKRITSFRAHLLYYFIAPSYDSIKYSRRRHFRKWYNNVSNSYIRRSSIYRVNRGDFTSDVFLRKTPWSNEGTNSNDDNKST